MAQKPRIFEWKPKTLYSNLDGRSGCCITPMNDQSCLVFVEAMGWGSRCSESRTQPEPFLLQATQAWESIALWVVFREERDIGNRSVRHPVVDAGRWLVRNNRRGSGSAASHPMQFLIMAISIPRGASPLPVPAVCDVDHDLV